MAGLRSSHFERIEKGPAPNLCGDHDTGCDQVTRHMPMGRLFFKSNELHSIYRLVESFYFLLNWAEIAT